MIKLTIGNSFSKIENITREDFNLLRNELSYVIKDSFFSGSFNPKRYLVDSRGIFPSGLLHRIYEWLYKLDRNYECVDLRLRPPNPTGIGYPLNLPIKPYLEQLEAVKTAIEHHRGTIQMVTGAGKSITAALLIAKLGVKTLVIVPNLNLKAQLIDNFCQYFSNLSNITIKNIDDPSLEKDTDYGCLIIDESHHVAAKTYRILNKKAWKNIYYRFFLTATPYRNKEEEQMLMESISGQVIYTLPYAKGVEMGAIVPIESYYLKVPHTNIELYTYSEVYSKLVVHNTPRNEQIASLARNLMQANTPTLILVKEIAHGRLLAKLTGLPFACGEDANSVQLIDTFNKGKTSLIGTTGVLGEGCDTRPAEYIIIASLGKSKPQFMQMIGRGLRRFNNKESCKVIIFKDDSHKFVLRHFKEQVKILKEEYGIIPALLEAQ